MKEAPPPSNANSIIPPAKTFNAAFSTVPMTDKEQQASYQRCSTNLKMDLTNVVSPTQTPPDANRSAIAMFCHRIAETNLYRTASFLSVFIALFLSDITRACFNPSADIYTEVIVLVAFLFLLCDLIIQSIAYPKTYLFSFMFWLDVVGTLTLLADMNLALSLLGISDLTVARGGRAGRAARSAGSLRISRVVMWARVARLMKIARILRFLKENTKRKAKTKVHAAASPTATMASGKNVHINSHVAVDRDLLGIDDEEEEDPQQQMARSKHASKIGLRVSDSVTRDVVFGILLTVSLTPIFMSNTEETFSSMYLAINWFDYYVSHAGISALDDYVGVFLSENDNVCRLQINGTDYKHDEALMDGLRVSEVLHFYGDATVIALDVSENVKFSHGMNIGFTMLIVCLFAGLAFLISSSISKLVVHPIERMTKIIQEFTKNICFLGGDIDDQQTIVSALLETEVIEKSLQTLSNIFASLTSNVANGDKHSAHVQYTPALSKYEGTTVIKSRDSILNINVQQQQRAFVSEEEIEEHIKVLEGSTSVEAFVFKQEEYDELKNVASTMSHPVCSQYFRSFCDIHHAAENFNFVRAVNEYQTACRKEYWKVWARYLRVGAQEEIITNSKRRAHCYQLYEQNKFGVAVFEEFRAECLKSLQSQVFKSFIDSKWAIAYVVNLDDIKRRYKHVFDTETSVLESVSEI